MERVELDFFTKAQFPCQLKWAAGTLYFLLKQADLDENKNVSDLYALKDGKALRLTASRDVAAYYPVEDGIIFPAMRTEKDKEKAKKGEHLTVLQFLPHSGGEAREFLRLSYAAGDFQFITQDRFLFTALYDHDLEAAKKESGGDMEKALAKLKEDRESCDVMDELPFWANGEGMVNKRRSRLYMYDKGNITPLTGEYTQVRLLNLSPEKKQALYVASTYTDSAPLFDQLMLLDLSTQQIRELKAAPQASHQAAAFLSEETVAVAASRCLKYGVNENAGYFTISLKDGSVCLLSDGGNLSFGNSVGSDMKMGNDSYALYPWRDGFAFIATQGYDAHLFFLKEGEPARQITREGGMVSECAVGDGKLYALCMRGLSGMEAYEINPDGTETQLTHLNKSLADYQLSAPQKITFPNENGNIITGFVIPPMNIAPGQKAPVILDIHGGPKTAYGTVLFHEMQYWAQNGYAVIFCNPTGSDGGGNGFADIRGRYGETDYRDIMTFVDTALRTFDYLDGNRMGVTGGSYGGFMTNWIIGHTNRFLSAATQRSIASWISFSNMSDIGDIFGEDQMASSCWKDVEQMWRQSPLKYADRIKTPTLVLHSDNDYRCPVAEGIQLFYALRHHNIPSRLCVFHGENHELSRSGKPKNRIRRLREITAWMDKYLKKEDCAEKVEKTS
jgi:dipeptidyl aminopeptidase/acylaminoacyl peptidase